MNDNSLFLKNYLGKNKLFYKRIIKIILLIIIIYRIIYMNKLQNESNFENVKIEKSKIIMRNVKKELKIVQKYINNNFNNNIILYDKSKIFYKNKNPKISIIITVYNGEPYIETALRSIQNQDFTDIEIIIIDDCSKDNSIKLIKKLMIKDHRILLFNNKENKGMLYTKSKGVLNAKGKYVMLLDVDDIYLQNDVFSTLYVEAERNNLDILGFGGIISSQNIKERESLINYIITPVLHQPDIQNIMYYHSNNNQINRGIGGYLAFYFIKTEKLIKSIKEIDIEYFNTKMNFHDDLLIFFILSRNVSNLRQIKRIFYMVIKWNNNLNQKMIFRLNEKNKNKDNLQCLAYIKYIKFLLIKTNNTVYDKQIALFELKRFYINHKCKNNTFIKKMGVNLCKLFLENKFILKFEKNIIINFLNILKI